jgi:hypothetical protein
VPPDPQYRFRGFREPRYTQIPDEFFDEVAPNLTEAELRVALYVLRRTFGFKKHADAISFSQMGDGITTKDGRILDRGTGMSRSAVWRGTKGLVEKGILVVTRRVSQDGDNEANVYSLRFDDGAEAGVVLQENHGRSAKEPGVTLLENLQETEGQETGRQHFEDSKGPVSFEKYDQARLAILPYAEDLARELGDQAPLSSTTTRLTNLYRDSGLELDQFLDLLIRARAITQERTPAIRTPRPEGLGPKPKVSYWFAVLQDLIGQAQAATGNAHG